MGTYFVIDAVTLALPAGRHALTEGEIVQCCRADTPMLERRDTRHVHGDLANARQAMLEIQAEAASVMVAIIGWTARGGPPKIGHPGSFQCHGTPLVSVLELWERPYKAKLRRHGFFRGIVVEMQDWQQGTTDIKDWPIGNGEWPVWKRPEFKTVNVEKQEVCA